MQTISKERLLFFVGSEGFSADISELTDFQPVPTTQNENPPQTEDESTTFLPVLSSTDQESPPVPPKRIYGLISIVQFHELRMFFSLDLQDLLNCRQCYL